MYKIDNKNQKAKTKNLELRLDFQKYNIKEKKKGKKNTTTTTKTNKQTKSHKNYLKTTTTTQRLYMAFALKKKVVFFLKSNSRL